MIAIGVDGCRSGWFYARLDGDQAGHGVVARLEDLLGAAPASSALLVDIPIGLRDREGTARLCDSGARALLGGQRASSVFNAPIRAILGATGHAAANALSRRYCGKGVSAQTFNISAKIREVDELMQTDFRARSLLREAHPELCFFGLAGGRPMRHSKRSRAGFEERRALLAALQPGAGAFIEAALQAYPRKQLARDDIVDALVLAVTARRRSAWRTVPASPERDSRGLPMEIVYVLAAPAREDRG